MRFAPVFLLMTILIGPAMTAGLDPKEMGDWEIVVSTDAIPSEKHAAKEFQSLFAQAAGVELGLVETADPAALDPWLENGPRKKIVIGPTASPTDLFPKREWASDEQVLIVIKEDFVALGGGRPRGALYAVYEFFDRYFGVRYLTHDHTHFPELAADFTIPLDYYIFNPALSFRWSYYKENADQPGFAAKLHVNTVSDDPRFGGKTPQHLINHTFGRWLPAAKYGEEHPEYFALVDGKRPLDLHGGGPELCVSKPKVMDIVADAVIEHLDANPTLRNISVSQNDNDAYCRCATCEAINDREGTPMGANLMLVNAVAARVAEKHPEVKVGTLAYWYTRQAPKTIKPRDNVQIQLCSIECCTLYPIDDPDCKLNRSFCKDVEDWKAICDDIWIWNYNTNFSSYDLPFPNLRAIGKNVNFFLENNAKGIFMQANGNGNSGEMCDLRNYVIANCLWKPGRKSWELVEEFCRLHYRAAADPILEYLTLLHDNAEERGVQPGCFPTAIEVGLTPEIAKKAMELFAKALEVADDAAVRARVEKASICAYKATIATHGSMVYEDGKCILAIDRDHPGLVEKYKELCRKHNMTRTAETVDSETYFTQLDETRKGVAGVRIENKIWRMTLIPSQNGKTIELVHKPSGRDIVAAPSRAANRHRSMEEWGLQGYEKDTPSNLEAFVDDEEAILTKTLEDGSTLVRKITLGESVRFETTITHRGDEPNTYQTQIHPEYDAATQIDDATLLSVYLKGEEGWKQINQDWKGSYNAPGQEPFDAYQGGEFAFFNNKAGFGVLETFDPEQMVPPKLYWAPGRQQVNLELNTAPVELAKGESTIYSYEVHYLDESPVE